MGLKEIIKKDKAYDKIISTKKILQRILEIKLDFLHQENTEKSKIETIRKKSEDYLKKLQKYDSFKSVCTYTYLPIGLREIINFAEEQDSYYSKEYFSKLLKAEANYFEKEVEKKLNEQIEKKLKK